MKSWLTLFSCHRDKAKSTFEVKVRQRHVHWGTSRDALRNYLSPHFTPSTSLAQDHETAQHSVVWYPANMASLAESSVASVPMSKLWQLHEKMLQVGRRVSFLFL